jgi:hypothetical protein
VTTAALDYIEGFLERDPDRHRRAYHPECIKRRFVTDEKSGIDELQVLSPQIMVDYASTGNVEISNCEVEVVIDDISEGMASVRVYSCHWVDFLHIVKAEGPGGCFTSLGTPDPPLETSELRVSPERLEPALGMRSTHLLRRVDDQNVAWGDIDQTVGGPGALHVVVVGALVTAHHEQGSGHILAIGG